MNKYLGFIIFSIFFQSLASIIGKKTGLLLNKESFLSFNIIFGIIIVILLLLIQGYFWTNALKIIPLSYAYSLNALTFVIMMIIAVLIFDEEMSFFNFLGSAIIILGIFCLSKVKVGG